MRTSPPPPRPAARRRAGRRAPAPRPSSSVHAVPGSVQQSEVGCAASEKREPRETVRAMPQRVLITGGSGAVGSAVVARMLERRGEFEPVVFDLAPSTNALDGGKQWPAGSNVMSIIGDISSFDDVKTAMAGCDAVIHLANSGSEWEDNLKYNIIGTYNIFENAAKLGAPHSHLLPCHSFSHTNLKSPCAEQVSSVSPPPRGPV